jgi:DNA-binding beta-propeller fold protein YncE
VLGSHCRDRPVVSGYDARVAGTTSAISPIWKPERRGRLQGYFNFPASIASVGTHVWVANYSAESVTELDARTGRMVKVISGSGYEFKSPFAIAADGTHVWVANIDGYSVTELSARTGHLIKVISGSR